MRASIFLVIIFLILSCDSPVNQEIIDGVNSSEDGIWIVAETDIKGGGKTYELMNAPVFGMVQDFLGLSDHEKVALVSFNGEVRVYPYYFTNYYEVVNDVFDNKNIAITYCPLTKSGICFERTIDGNTFEILASGYLYKDNMIPSDKNQNFFWSQMLMEVIGNNKSGTIIKNYNLIETNWKTVKTYFPNAKVFYHDKRQVNETPINASVSADSEYIFGVVNQKIGTEIELFQYEIFTAKTKIIEKIHNNKPTIIIGNKDKLFVTAYYTKENLVFSLVNEKEFPNIIKDNEGNIWNIFGYAVSGPRMGDQLESPKSYVAQYWAFKDFYDNITFYK